jgi:signal transduction histidine kinase
MARGIETSQASGAPIAYVTQPIFQGLQIIGAVHMSYSLDQIQDAQRELQAVIIGVVLAMALIVSVFSVQLAQHIRRPLMRVAVAAARIADGDLTQRVLEEAPSELALVAHNFNRMAEALQTVEQARNATFANIAHDVRTPIGSMRAAAEALLNGAVDQPELRMRLLNGIITQAQYLSRLSDDLLRLATYEAGGLVLRRDSMSLSNLIEEALRGFEARALAHDICVELDLPPSLPEVYVDSDRVLEILFNLLDNALSYTSPHGWIRVSARHDPLHGVVWVHVCDAGAVIPQDTLPHVFERSWRGE